MNLKFLKFNNKLYVIILCFKILLLVNNVYYIINLMSTFEINL